MKKNKSAWVFVLLLLISLFAMGAFQGAAIKGTVRPPQAVTDVWAISGRDTFRGLVVENAFEISKLRSGIYMVVIEVKPPYKKAVRENIEVKEGQMTDIGEIVLAE